MTVKTATFPQPTPTGVQFASVATTPVVTGVQSQHTRLFAQHVIETELLQGYPRVVQRLRPLWTWQVSLGWVGMGIQCLNSYSSNSKKHESFWMWLLYFAMFSLLNIYMLFYALGNSKKRTAERKEYQLLRYGIPTPAIVSDIVQVDKEPLVEFQFTDRYGVAQTRSLQMSGDAVKEQKFQVGSTFTLLLSHENDYDFLPYWQVKSHTVVPVPATAVSQAISRTIAAQPRTSSAAMSSSLGAIEPELLLHMPRRTRFVGQFWRDWWGCFALASLATAAWFVWHFLPYVIAQDIGTRLNMMNLCCVISLFVVLLHGTRTENTAFLKRGIATRAQVSLIQIISDSNITPPHQQQFSVFYDYETRDGSIYKTSIVLSKARLQQLGIAEGVTFTVLYFPGNPPRVKPYFLIRDTEIIGTTSANVTQPAKGRP